MLAGMMAGAGYYMGSQPLPVNFGPAPHRRTNPKGTFEDVEINAINEEILDSLYPPAWPTPLGRAIHARRFMPRGLRWAAALPGEIEVTANDAQSARIREQTAHEPFCFKDPRFSYTLPAWRPHVGEAAFVCVFREPARTANSIVAEWSGRPRRYAMTYERALAAWRCPYRQILNRHRRDGDWLFLHYDQILDGSAVRPVEAFLDATVDRSFPDPTLKRSSAEGEIGSKEREMYECLCELAGYPHAGGQGA
jgi:hypothetical protein